MNKHCMIAAAALLSANAIASQPVSTLETVMATPMTQGEMAKVEGKALVLFTTTSLSTGATILGRFGGPVPAPAPVPVCQTSWCTGTFR